ncbi:hypothetical protein [Flavobacterium proteolyticum]|uniref:Uncharacterized protein n=1 Tax=Flavobacterium proteolyticum TaxID=2911683 RepID=A0ABR9WPX2_9FLAO|nr:hypothetical protein [Flavobacterium proteolyticum]MBE9575959.1 hypothetical protein [Flavobacterium proteolyticum]
MKKRVSAELVSIAHRILKLKNHSETVQLQQEAKNLYDQLTILRFYEENFELVKNEISEEVLEAKLERKQADIFEQPIPVVEGIAPAKEEPVVEEPIVEEKAPTTPIEEEKIVVAELIVEDDEDEEEEVLITSMEEEPIEEEIIEEVPVVETPKAEEPAKQISFEDLLVHDYQELDFVKVEDVPVEVEKVTETVFEAVTPVEEVKEEVQPEPVLETPKVLEEEVKATFEKVSQEPKISSLNDRLNKAITFGLNDRIGFEKKLFGGSSDDFNRVVSQLNTFDSFEEAKAFVDDFVKPDYNNWEGAEEFETRFMEIVEKKFS